MPEEQRVEVTIHPSADVAADAKIGKGTRVWHQAQVREGAVIGAECIIGKGAYVDFGVKIGDRCKLQNGVFVFHGFNLEDGVFLGPGVMLLNDKNPRAINPDGTLKSGDDWKVSQAVVRYGAAVGGGAVILPGVEIGRFALVGAGAVVTRAVPGHGIAVGNPARLVGFACDSAHRLHKVGAKDDHVLMRCAECGTEHRIPIQDHEQIRRVASRPSA